MSARTLAWSELTGPHLSRHLADRQAEKDWAKFRPGPEPTWEEVREAWMAGGGEHRRDVATPEGVLGTNCACESVYAAAEAGIKSESNFVDLCANCHGTISVLTCAPDDNSGARCTCQWTCAAHNKLIDASNTTCRQKNDYHVDPCPPMWSDEYVPPVEGSGGSGGGWSDAAGCSPNSDCFTLESGSASPVLSPFIRVPSACEIGFDPPDEVRLCGQPGQVYLRGVRRALRLLVQDGDIVAYALCRWVGGRVNNNGLEGSSFVGEILAGSRSQAFVITSKLREPYQMRLEHPLDPMRRYVMLYPGDPGYPSDACTAERYSWFAADAITQLDGLIVLPVHLDADGTGYTTALWRVGDDLAEGLTAVTDNLIVLAGILLHEMIHAWDRNDGDTQFQDGEVGGFDVGCQPQHRAQEEYVERARTKYRL